MKNRMKIFIWLMMLIYVKQTQAVEPITTLIAVTIAVAKAATLTKISVAAGSIAGCYYLDKWINGPQREDKNQRRHEEHMQYVRNLSPQQLEEHLVQVNGCNTIYEVPASYLFEQYAYYQFPEFQKLLIDHPLFETSITALHQDIKKGKKIDFYTCEEQKKFEDAVDKLANIVDERRSIERFEAQETQRRVEQQRIKQEKQNHYKQQINVTLNQEKDECDLLCEYYAQEIEFIQYSENQIPKELEARYRALMEHDEGKDVWSEQRYTLPNHTHKLLDEHAIQAEDYRVCYGNQIQQVVHKELIAILEGTAQLRYVNLLDQDIKGVTTAITLFAHAGHMHNHAGHIPTALSFVDFCWNVLELSEHFTRAVVEGCLEDFKCCYRYGAAGTRGALKGAKNFGNSLVAVGRFCRDVAYHCAHPIEAARIVCPKIKACTEFVAQRIAEGREAQEKLIKSNSPLLFYWHMPTKEEIALREAQHKEAIDLTVQATHQFLEALPTYLTPEAIEHGIEKSSEIATEMALSYATGRAMGAMAQAGANALASSLEGLHYMHEVPATMGGMQAIIVLEAIELAEAAIALRMAGDNFAQLGDIAGKLGSVGTGLSNIAPVGDQGTVFDYPTDPIEVAKAIEIEKARVTELARMQGKFKMPLQGLDRPIHENVACLDATKMNHILVPKHDLHKILVDPKNEEDLRRLLNVAIRDGTLTQVAQSDVYKKTLKLINESFVIQGKLDAKGEIRVGTAWIE